MSFLYQELADELKAEIVNGHYLPGDRLPGIRRMSIHRNLSVATVLAAYRQLQDHGYLETRPKSGFFIRARADIKTIKQSDSNKQAQPCAVEGQEMVMAMMKAASDPRVIKLGSAIPASAFLPLRGIEKSLAKAIRTQRRLASYEMPAGAPELRQQLARRMAETGAMVTPENILITNGCQEALTLALRATTKPGDIVAIESPTFYGVLQVIESLGLKALEIPTHPTEGIAADALQVALENWPVKACVIVPNFSNPLGYVMSDYRKRAILKLLKSKQVPLIEDDSFGDLGFSGPRPSSFLGLDETADVMYCSGFAKTIAPDLRVGWLTSNHRQSKLEFLKFTTNLACPSVTQLAVAYFLESGKYDRHLRQVKGEYERALNRTQQLLEEFFPDEIRVSSPQGGYVLWLQLPEHIDAVMLAGQALDKAISIAPGPIFSPTGKFRNCLRISFASAWEAEFRTAMKALGSLVTRANRSRSASVA